MTGGEILQRLSPLLRDTFTLTASSLLLRLLGLAFQSRMTRSIGAEGMGLLSLAMNAEALAVTLGSSGVRYSVTRLTAEELSHPADGVRSILRAAARFSMLCSFTAAALLFCFAENLSAFAGDERIALSLRCFALGIPALALNSILSGYFTAKLAPWKTGTAQIAEQLCLILLTALLLPRVPKTRLDLCCAAIAVSGTASNLLSLLFSYLLYRYRNPLPALRPGSVRKVGPRLLHLSLPLAFSGYARTALSTLQHLLVPKALRRSGYGAEQALAVYGTVSGMVFPVLGFASVFFSALSEMLIPRLTAAQLRGDRRGMERSAERILTACLLFSSLTSLLLYLLGPWLGQKLYRSGDAGLYIRVLAPLVTVMYLDSVVDGMLKGLGLQFSSMVINLTDAALTLICVCVLLPRYGTAAYIGILYLSECFNFLLSFLRLRKELCFRLLAFRA